MDPGFIHTSLSKCHWLTVARNCTDWFNLTWFYSFKTEQKVYLNCCSAATWSEKNIRMQICFGSFLFITYSLFGVNIQIGNVQQSLQQIKSNYGCLFVFCPIYKFVICRIMLWRVRRFKVNRNSNINMICVCSLPCHTWVGWTVQAENSWNAKGPQHSNL